MEGVEQINSQISMTKFVFEEYEEIYTTIADNSSNVALDQHTSILYMISTFYTKKQGNLTEKQKGGCYASFNTEAAWPS